MLHPEEPPALPRAVAAAIALIASAGAAMAVYQVAFSPRHRTDLNVFLGAASAMRRGADPYSIVNVRGWHFTSPPLAAVVFVPLTFLSDAAAAGVWSILNVALLAMAVRRCFAAFAWPPATPIRWLCWFAPMLLVGQWIWTTVVRGQWFIVITFLVVMAWRNTLAGRDGVAGFVLAIASALKLLPLIFLPYFLLKRRWGGVVGFGAGLLLTGAVLPAAVVGHRNVPTLYRRWMATVVVPAVTEGESVVYHELLDPSITRDQSLRAIVHRRSAIVPRSIAGSVGIALAGILVAVSL